MNFNKVSRRPSGCADRFVVTALMWLMLAASAQAQEKMNFDIPAQSAVDSVKALAEQSGLQIAALNEDLSGVRTNVVRGLYEPMEALRLLIAGTGLEINTNSGNAVTIRRRATPAPAASPSSNNGAQEEGTEELQAVIVTGSRIKRAGFDTLEAALVTNAEQIERRGHSNVADALQETPGFGPAATSPLHVNQGVVNVGQSFVDFFGLGSQRTLTLVNGRRFVSSNAATGSYNLAPPGQQVDMNAIPAGLVERVETIAIGGAPVYGSDAIAGTVNIILKDDFEGIHATAQFAETERGDARSETYRGLIGGNFAEGRGNAVLSLEHNEQDGIPLSERAGFIFRLPNPNAPPGNVVSVDYTLNSETEGGLPLDPATIGFITDASGRPLHFAPDGSLVPMAIGADFGYGTFPETDGGDGVRFADHRGLLSPTQRTLISALAHYDLTPDVRAFVEVNHSRAEGRELSEYVAAVDPIIFGNTLLVDVNNPFLAQSARDTLAANGVTSFILSRNLSDLLDRGGAGTSTIDLTRVVGGLQGDFEAWGRSLFWDVSYNHGRSRNVSTVNLTNDARFQDAVDAVLDGSGNIVCRSTLTAPNNGCVPINLFGEFAFTDAAADYVTDRGVVESINTQRVLTANIGGELPFAVGGANPVAFSIGTEFREEFAESIPDGTLSTGSALLGSDILSPFIGARGGFSTDELYSEFVVPLISASQDVPFVKNVVFEGKIRYVDNSVAGGDTTWAAGGRFAPRLAAWGDGLEFRGVFTHAIRAPAVAELFSAATPTRIGISDPCDFALVVIGPNPAARRQNCGAALAALGYTDPYGSDPALQYRSTTAGTSPIGSRSGNPNLANETADSWSLGFVYQPMALPRLSLAIDWSDIEIESGILTAGINQILTLCYDSPSFPQTTGCNAFERLTAPAAAASPVPRVAGDVANGYREGYINAASIKFAGLIVSAEYGFALDELVTSWSNAGSLRLSAKLFHTNRYEVLRFPGLPVIENAGIIGTPKYSGQFNVTYSSSRFDVSLQSLYASSVKTTTDQGAYPDEFYNVDAYWKFNSTIGYRVTDSLRAQLVVNNVFDNQPSLAQIFSRNYGTYDLLGRRYLVSLAARF